MCGILGIYSLTDAHSIDEEKFASSLDKMGHRGPDNRRTVRFSESVLLGHLRLSIIDLKDLSNQPFVDTSEKYSLVFNGEIYNYLEIKAELIALGCEFRTSSDTEVLLYSYVYWGESCVNKFNGMWAFAIWDSQEGKLFCSRDRFGIKPFNYAYLNGQFIFASEIKSILNYFPELKVPNYNIIANYCRSSLGAQTEESWFEQIFRLKPAHNLIVDASGIRVERYWDYPRSVDLNMTFDEAKIEYTRIFESSVALRMRSDVPIGFTLSSGIDSTSIVSVLKEKFLGNSKSYTAAFTDTFFFESEHSNFKGKVQIDEPSIVRNFSNAIGLESTIVEISFSDYILKLRSIIYHLESGHGSPAIYPLNSILKRASDDITVVLEGQGADELLGGYISSVHPIFIKYLLKRGRLYRAVTEFLKFIRFYSLKNAGALFIRNSNSFFIQRFYYKFSGIDKLYKGKIKKYSHIKDYPIDPKGFDDDLNIFLFKAHTGGLVNLLHYGDAISMAHSLESRLPFMDYRLVEFVFKLPADFKVNNGLGKFIHREAMKGKVPDFILSNPLKFGFSTPLRHVFMNEEDNSASNILLSDRCLKRGLFSEEEIKISLNLIREGRKDISRYLYRMLNVELWFREFID